jgi:hypothetical protein
MAMKFEEQWIETEKASPQKGIIAIDRIDVIKN